MAAVLARYARAFADVVTERKLNAGAITRQLENVASTLADSRELREVWASPSIPTKQKIQLLDTFAQRLELAREARNFVAVLIEQRRVASLADIVALFKQEINERQGLAEAEVTTSRPLSDEQRSALEAQIAQRIGRRVIARYAEDPKILGGAVVKVGSTIYDGSVRGQLRTLREQMAAAE